MNHILKSIAYHRNGVSGNPFYVAIVESDGDDMLVITFPDTEGPSLCTTAVFKLAELDKRNIKFGSNSFRGDHWHDFMLNEAIPKHSADFDERLRLQPKHNNISPEACS